MGGVSSDESLAMPRSVLPTRDISPQLHQSMAWPSAASLFKALALGVIVFLIASSSIALTRFEGGAAFIWPATAPLLAVIAIRSPRDWLLPVCAAGFAFWLASTVFGLGPVTAIPLTLASVGEALVAATILRTARKGFAPFDTLPSFGLFALATGIVAPALSALIAGLTIAMHTHQAFWPNWWAWFAAHGLGTMTFAPLILLFFERGSRLWSRRAPEWRKIETVTLLFGVGLASFMVFDQEKMPLLFLPLLPIFVATFRIGRLGAASSVVLLAVIGGILTLKGHGPISLMDVSTGQRAQFFQFYLAVTVLMVLPAAVELKQRNALMSRSLESEASYRLLAEKLGDTMIHTNLSGDIRFVSPAIHELTGYDTGDVMGRNSRDFIIADDLAAVEAARTVALADSEHTIDVQYRIRARSGEVVWVDTRMRSYVDGDGFPAGVILVVRNATARRASEAQLNLQATTDELTGLPNRRAFLSHLDHARNETDTGLGVGCVALLDVDFFKRVNDTHGHITGDMVLRAIAVAARGALRSGDMVARIGGEEFGLVLWGATLDQAAATCERVRAAIAACRVVTSGGVHIVVTASLGLTAIEPELSGVDICDRADRLLYEAKANGRNRVLVAA
ncbi:MAG: hypothetical protein JWL66_1083 [Sphingomonadales bacterium]|nr:hypothetical protein [Sphingomonadales bacterium]